MECFHGRHVILRFTMAGSNAFCAIYTFVSIIKEKKLMIAENKVIKHWFKHVNNLITYYQPCVSVSNWIL